MILQKLFESVLCMRGGFSRKGARTYRHFRDEINPLRDESADLFR